MLALRRHRARLRSLGAFGVPRDEVRFVAHLQRIKAALDDAVAVEIDFVARRGGNKAAIPVGQQPRDSAMIRHGVQLHLASAIADMILEAAAQRVEGIADSDVSILVRVVHLWWRR